MCPREIAFVVNDNCNVIFIQNISCTTHDRVLDSDGAGITIAMSLALFRGKSKLKHCMVVDHHPFYYLCAISMDIIRQMIVHRALPLTWNALPPAVLNCDSLYFQNQTN